MIRQLPELLERQFAVRRTVRIIAQFLNKCLKTDDYDFCRARVRRKKAVSFIPLRKFAGSCRYAEDQSWCDCRRDTWVVDRRWSDAWLFFWL
jgi:hypothetical protein